MFGSGFSTLTILKEETGDIMRLVKSLEESGLLIKDIIDNKIHKFIDKR